MPNAKLRGDFEKGPAFFLSQYALVNPGSTNFDLGDSATLDAGTFLNEYLGYGGTRAEYSLKAAQAWQAKSKTMYATLDYLSMVGGEGSSGRITGWIADNETGSTPGNIRVIGTPTVSLRVGLKETTGLPVYFLPWKGDHSVTMTLGQDARFFVTAAMSGCTFDVTGPPEAPVVTHANAGARAKGEKLAHMNSLIKEGIKGKLMKGWTPGGQYTTTRLQTGLWGENDEKALREVNYAIAEDAYKSRFDSHVAGLQRNSNSYATGEIEVESTLEGDHKQITVAVVGWRPPGDKRWEFYYQVWADFTLTRRVYRREKKFFGGTKRRELEKMKISDWVLLVPGAKLWPGGRGWPNSKAGKISA